MKRKAIPLRITIIYILTGCLWILLSDRVLSLCVTDDILMMRIQTLKGWFYVLGTACLLYLLIARNMNIIHQSQKELKNRESQYRLVIDGTTDGLWDWNVQTNDTYLSPRWKNKLGYEDWEIPNTFQSWKDLLHPDDLEIVLQAIDDYLNKRTPKYKIEYRARKKNGEYAWALAQGQAIWKSNGNAVRVVGIHTDITERKNTEIILRNTMEENRRLLSQTIEYDKLKTELFSNVSHEFRTPLNVILGTIQLMDIYYKKSKDIDDYFKKTSKHIAVMKQNCYRLLRLVNNLLDITRIDSGFMKVNLNNHNIVEVIEQITLSVTDYVGNKSINLIFDTDIEEKVIACDIDKIERIMLNLLSNALKYTKPGGNIQVNIYDKIEKIIISVKDSGIGISDDKKNLIFERFGQVNSSLTRENEGSGIGLSLVKSLVEMHGGRVWVESEYGFGSNFLIELPCVQSTEVNPSLSNASIAGVNRVERVKVEFSDIYLNS